MFDKIFKAKPEPIVDRIMIDWDKVQTFDQLKAVMEAHTSIFCIDNPSDELRELALDES